MKAKTAIIKLERKKIDSVIMKYVCPKCKVNFEVYGKYDKNVTRFLCDCGQEIICDYRG